MSETSQGTFWRAFREQHWERTPVVVRGPLSPGSPLGGAELFEVLLRASTSDLKEGERHLRLFIDGKHELHPGKWLPRPSDESFRGYHARMTDELGSRSYCLILNEAQMFAAQYWRPITDFLSGVYEAIGVPIDHVESSLYLGNYTRTPFGVHRDRCGVMHFPIEGTKKIRVWDPEYVAVSGRALISRHEYADHIAHSQLLEGRPGEMIYWPSSHWHTGESEGEFCVTWGFGFWIARSPQAVLWDEIETLLAHAQALPEKSGTVSWEPEAWAVRGVELPPSFARLLSALQDSVTSALPTALSRTCLEQVTGCGFRSVPVPLPAFDVTAIDRIHRESPQPIHWTRREDGTLLVSAMGHSFAQAFRPCLLSLIAEINSGRVLEVSRLLADLSPEKIPAENLFFFLNELGRFRGIAREGFTP